MSGIFHPLWTTHYRPTIRTAQLAEIEITRSTGTGYYDPVTREYVGGGTAQTIYTGSARWQKVGMTTKRHLIDDYGQFNRVRVVIMMEDLPEDFVGFMPNDKVTLTANDSNPQSVGDVVYLWGDPTSANAWQITLNCQQNMKQEG